MTYLDTVNGWFYFRMRVPKDLSELLQRQEITKSLKTKNKRKAKEVLHWYIHKTHELFWHLRSPIVDSEKAQELILEYRQEVLHQNTSEKPPKSPNKSESQTTKPVTLRELKELYFKDREVAKGEVREITGFIEGTLYELLGSDYDITSLNRHKVLEIKETFKKLPRRNRRPYYGKPLKEILKMKIPPEHLLSDRYINKMLTWFASLMTCAHDNGLISNNPANRLTLKTQVDPRSLRKAFTHEELKKLRGTLQNDTRMRFVFDLCLYTGMIFSEIQNVKLIEKEGILCFSLLEHKGKTSFRKRLIPVHSSLLRNYDVEKLLIQTQEGNLLESNVLRKWIKGAMGELGIEDREKKSFYSLRHTFATALMNSDVREEVAIEITGHSHRSLTTKVYTKGFNVKLLKDAIEKLKFN